MRLVLAVAAAAAALAPALSHAQANYCSPISGVGDFHNHQFADLGFGGDMLVGKSYHPGGASQALKQCGDEDLLCLPTDEALAVCKGGCVAVSGACGGLCNATSGACWVGCETTRGLCLGGCGICSGVCEIPCFFDSDSDACIDCMAGCQSCYDGCNGTFSNCRGSCRLDCDACKLDCEGDCNDAACKGGPHGPVGTSDLLGLALGEKPDFADLVGHDVFGYPNFSGWPAYTTYTHQQAYYKWMERAFHGGVKLSVMMAVSNEVLCDFTGPATGFSCNDMAAVDAQIGAAKALEEDLREAHALLERRVAKRTAQLGAANAQLVAVDLENDGMVNGNGWYRIAYSAAHARQIIATGGMAVVLGAEVDSLFNCFDDGGCTPDSVRSSLQHYYDLGIRHLYPIHVWDNQFGGAAVYNDFFNFGQLIRYGRLFDVEDCSSAGYQFRFNEATNLIVAFISLVSGNLNPTLLLSWDDYAPAVAAHCNERGLTPLGQVLIEEMMARGMIIDVDHMSAKMRDSVFELAEQRGYPALVTGHGNFRALYENAPDPSRNHEGQLTTPEFDRLIGLGGKVALIHVQGHTNQLHQYERQDGGAAIADTCGNSSRSWAQAYLFAVERIGGFESAAVGMGSDWNGLAGQPTPRFGGNACAGDRIGDQGAFLAYPVALHDSIGGVMGRHHEGNRTFDVNFDGLAHAGMVPDFIADLRQDGLSDRQLDPLFRSTEAYLSMWEKVENAVPTLFLPSFTVDEGSPLPSVFFGDPDCDDTWGASVSFGDGNGGSRPAAGHEIALNHAYADNGTFTVSVTVSDSHGGVQNASTTATVRNVAPTVEAGADQTVDEGQVVALASSFADPGAGDTHVATVEWGDGTASEPAAANLGTVVGTHVYADNGTYMVAVCVRDDDGGAHCDTFGVTVRNVAPVVNAGPDLVADEGSVVPLPAAFRDAGTRDTHVATVNWGDGTPTGPGLVTESPFGPPGSSAGVSGTIGASHVYADNGPYTVTVCATDDDGGSHCDTLALTVRNVAPTVTPNADAGLDEAGTFTLGATAFNDKGTRDTHTATVDWGDNTPAVPAGVTETPLGPPGSASGLSGTVAGASRVYGDDGAYMVRVCVLDDDGGVGCGALRLTVHNVAPTAVLDATAAVPFGGAGGSAFLGRKGVEQAYPGSGSDVGSDDLRFTWTFPPGDAGTDPASVVRRDTPRTHYNDGRSAEIGGAFADPDPSSRETRFPFAADDTAFATYSMAGLYTAVVTVEDDDAGTAARAFAQVVTDARGCTLPAPVWLNNFLGRGAPGVDAYRLQRYLDVIGFTSRYFHERRSAATLTEATVVLSPSRGIKRAEAEQEALGAWLNFASGGVGWSETLRRGGTFATTMAAVEAVLLNPASSDRDLQEAARTAQSIGSQNPGAGNCE